jgi:hypothetical protein
MKNRIPVYAALIAALLNLTTAVITLAVVIKNSPAPAMKTQPTPQVMPVPAPAPEATTGRVQTVDKRVRVVVEVNPQ